MQKGRGRTWIHRALVVVSVGLTSAFAIGCDGSGGREAPPLPAPGQGSGAGPASLPSVESADPGAGLGSVASGEPGRRDDGPVASPTEVGKSRKTASGLTYETLKAGSGPMARQGDTVTVHYVGTLKDGKVFDSSRERDKPLTFQVGEERFVLGWNEGVEGMQAGERRKLTLPPNLGYGALGRLPAVPPNADLVFDIELLKIGSK